MLQSGLQFNPPWRWLPKSEVRPSTPGNEMRGKADGDVHAARRSFPNPGVQKMVSIELTIAIFGGLAGRRDHAHQSSSTTGQFLARFQCVLRLFVCNCHVGDRKAPKRTHAFGFLAGMAAPFPASWDRVMVFWVWDEFLLYKTSSPALLRWRHARVRWGEYFFLLS